MRRTGDLLTYMSIEELIQTHLASGELVRVLAQLGDRTERTMFIGADVVELLETSWTPEQEEEERRAGFLLGDLEAFVRGKEIGACMVPGEADRHAHMAILDPAENGMWDLRSVKPPPGLRVVGFFAKPDVFVGLRWGPRSVEWLDRAPLEHAESRQWRDVILLAQREWDRLFLGLPPFVGDDFDDYITSKGHRV